MCTPKRNLISKMAALPSNEDILRDYFDSDDNISEFEGFSDNELIYTFQKSQVVVKMRIVQVNPSEKMTTIGQKIFEEFVLNPSQKTLALFFQMISMSPLHQRRIIFS